MEKIKNLWKIEELRNRLLFTVALLFLFRLGCALPVPFVNGEMLQSIFTGQNLFSYLDIVSGSALNRCAVFALGVSAYINASIVLQLLCVAIPVLETMQKEEPKRVQKIMRYISLGFAVIMSIGYYAILRSYGALQYTGGLAGFFTAVVVIATFVAGAQMVMWFGWLIDDYGIGNGISLIIFAGILSRWSDILYLFTALRYYIQQSGWLMVAVVACIPVLALFSIYFVVKTSDAEKRITVGYSGGSRGNTTNYIPVKLIMSGVMPIIFASTIMTLPATFGSFLDSAKHPTLYGVLTGFNTSNPLYVVLYIVLIFLFNYFYIEIQFDTVQIANNIRSRGGAIPGIRPGKPTSEYLAKAAHGLAPWGALVLAIIAAFPIILSNVTGLSIQLGGTSLLIVCGVAIEELEAINAYLVMRHHKGFLTA